MKSNTRILQFVAVAALAAGSIPAASAAGLLGQRYASATFDWALPDDTGEAGLELEDGHGITLVLNMPLSQNIDLSVSYSFIDSGASIDSGEGISKFDANAQGLLFGSTFYTSAGGVKPFLKLAAGWVGAKAAGETDNNAAYEIVPGIEIPAGEKASLSLYAGWNDYFDKEPEDDGYWTFGAIAEFEISSKWSILAHGNVDDDTNWGISAGALLRF